MQAKFLKEEPAKHDSFKAKSHEIVARAIYKCLSEDNDINIIGIEGALGSGKSTVINLLKDNHCADYDVVEFDIERYQHGSIKKALIETIYKHVASVIQKNGKSNKKEKDEKAIKLAKDIALGNHLKYKVENEANINLSAILFTGSLLLATQTISPAIDGAAGFFSYLSNEFTGYDFDLSATIHFIISIIPLLILSIARFKFPTISKIFQRNNHNIVNETFDITREVGPYELENSLQEFVKYIPEKNQTILVLDNLDRVTSNKFGEVWSDIEIFSSVAGRKIQLVIPYSKKHIHVSLNGKDNMKYDDEYIYKRIPVTFKVPPLITVDWKLQLKNIWLKHFQILKIKRAM